MLLANCIYRYQLSYGAQRESKHEMKGNNIMEPEWTPTKLFCLENLYLFEDWSTNNVQLTDLILTWDTPIQLGPLQTAQNFLRGGVRVCGDAVLLEFWCRVAGKSLYCAGFAVLLYGFLCGVYTYFSAVFVPPYAPSVFVNSTFRNTCTIIFFQGNQTYCLRALLWGIHKGSDCEGNYCTHGAQELHKFGKFVRRSWPFHCTRENLFGERRKGNYGGFHKRCCPTSGRSHERCRTLIRHRSVVCKRGTIAIYCWVISPNISYDVL